MLRVIPIPTANSEKSHTQRPNGKLHRSDLVLMAHFSHLSDQQISTRKKVRASTVSRKKTALPKTLDAGQHPLHSHQRKTWFCRGAPVPSCPLLLGPRGPLPPRPPPEDCSRHPFGSETDRGSLRFGQWQGGTSGRHQKNIEFQ